MASTALSQVSTYQGSPSVAVPTSQGDAWPAGGGAQDGCSAARADREAMHGMMGLSPGVPGQGECLSFSVPSQLVTHSGHSPVPSSPACMHWLFPFWFLSVPLRPHLPSQVHSSIRE